MEGVSYTSIYPAAGAVATAQEPRRDTVSRPSSGGPGTSVGRGIMDMVGATEKMKTSLVFSKHREVVKIQSGPGTGRYHLDLRCRRFSIDF